MKSTNIRKYYLCEASIVAKIFTSLNEREEYINIEINNINNDKKSGYFLEVNKNQGKNPLELRLIIYRKLEGISTLKSIDMDTISKYGTGLLAQNSPELIDKKRKLIIINKIGRRLKRLKILPYDAIPYLNEEYLSERIFSLMESGDLKTADITCLDCVSHAKDLNDFAETMSEIQGKYDEGKIAELTDMRNAVKNFVARLHVNVRKYEQWRRFRDIALFIQDIDQKKKENDTDISKEQAVFSSIDINEQSVLRSVFSGEKSLKEDCRSKLEDSDKISEAVQIGLFGDAPMEYFRK